LLGALALVGYLIATGILLSVKVKVLGGGIRTYGWVTILLYCLWLNEHTHFYNILERCATLRDPTCHLDVIACTFFERLLVERLILERFEDIGVLDIVLCRS
jgi:hypothetical protein